MACKGCILVVEDDRDVRDALREHVERLGCRVVVAVDGIDALKCLETSLPSPPCAIVADLDMPRLDGAGLIAAVRGDERHARTPVITMSAEIHQNRPPGVALHLEKPFCCAELDANIATLCAGGPARHRRGAASLASD